YMQSANINEGWPSISKTIVTTAPTPNRRYVTGWWLMKPSTNAFIIEACGDANTGRTSPATASPNWKVLASMLIVRPTAMADAITPRNFTFSCAAGVEPNQ